MNEGSKQSKLTVHANAKMQLEDENVENLSIRPLKPCTPQTKVDRQNTFTETEDNESSMSPPKEYRSTNFITKSSSPVKRYQAKSSSGTRERRISSKPEITIFKRKHVVKRE